MPPTIIVTGSAGQAAAKHLRSSVTRNEAITLYRDILRTAKAFHWCDEKGIPWHSKLRAEARKEFEAGKEERDPLLIARMLVTGRECVQEVQRKFNDADRKCWERIQRDSMNRDGGGDGRAPGRNGNWVGIATWALLSWIIAQKIRGWSLTIWAAVQGAWCRHQMGGWWTCWGVGIQLKYQHGFFWISFLFNEFLGKSFDHWENCSTDMTPQRHKIDVIHPFHISLTFRLNSIWCLLEGKCRPICSV